MSRLRLSLANESGQVEHVQLHEALPGAAPLRMSLKAGQKIFIQVDGRQQTGQELVLGKKPALRKNGNDLILEVDGVSFVEWVDFYTTEGVSLSGDAWVFDNAGGLAFAAGAVFAVAVSETAAVGVSGTGTGKDLAAVGMSGTGQDLAAVGVSGTGQDLAAVGMSGTGQDLAAVGVSGTGQDLAAVGMSGTGQDLAAVGVSGTGQDLAAVGVSGTGQDLAAVGVSGTGTGKDLAAVGVSGTGQDLAAVGVSGTGQDLAAVGVSGTGTGKDLAAVGVSGTGRDLAAVGLSGTGRDLASIGITGTGVNSWMAGISMLPLIGSLDGGDSGPSASVVRGSVVAGPVTQGLEVQLFKLEGGRLVALEERAVVQAGGSWTYVVKGYTGPLVARVIDTNDVDGHANTNYISELTRQEVDIQANLMTAFNLKSGVKTVQINALTTIAAMKAGLQINGEGALEQTTSDFGASKIETSNRAVADVCGLTDLVSGDVKAVIQFNGNNNAGANEYGKLVAAIEGAGGNDDAILKRFAEELILDGDTATLSKWYKNQWVLGASKVENEIRFEGMTGVVGEMLARAYSSQDVQIAAIGGNGIVDDSERPNLRISVTVTLPAASLNVEVDGQRVTPSAVSQENGVWQFSLPDNAWTYGAHEITVEAVAASGEVLGTASRLFNAIDTTAPVITQVAVIGQNSLGSVKTTALVAGDIIKVELTTSEEVNGWASGDKVSITVGSTQRDAFYVSSAGNTHQFTYTVVESEIDAEGGIAVANLTVGQVFDAAGNRLISSLPAQTNTVSVDALAPVIEQLVISGVDSANNPKNGPLVAGDQIRVALTTSEAVVGWASGDKVTITVGELMRDALYLSSNGNTHVFSYTVVEGEMDQEGGISVGALSVAQVRDVAGNVLNSALPSQSNAVLVDAFVTKATVTGVLDDFGLVQGQVAAGKKTDDNSLTVVGILAQALTEGDVIKLYDGTQELSGEVTLLTDASWTFNDTRTLNPGQTVNYLAKVHDAAGNVGTQGGAYAATVSIPLGSTLSVTAKNASGGFDGVGSDDGVSADAFEGLATVAGADGNDRLIITNGVQTDHLAVLAEAGNDTISVAGAVSGFGSIEGGLGNDNITFSGSHSGNSTLSGADGNDTVVFSGVNSGYMTAVGGAGNDSISFSGSVAVSLFVDLLAETGGFGGYVGAGSNNTGSFSFEGFERLGFGSGNDTIVVAVNVNGMTVDGGSGNDMFDATAMTAGSVSVVAGNGADTIWLGSGTDTVYVSREAAAGNDILSGGMGSDLLRYDDHSSPLTLNITGVGADGGVSGLVTGAASVGTDIFTGFERLWGGKGNDTFVISAPLGSVSVDGSQGNDVLSYASHTAGLTVNVTTSTGGHVIKTNDGLSATDSFFAIESIVAGSGDDTITVLSSVTGALFVEDGQGSDTVALGSGNDTLYVTLETAFANDSYMGGAGVDELSYTAQTAALTVSVTSSNSAGGVDGAVFAEQGIDVFQGFEVLRLGGGNDSVVIAALSANVTIFDGDGNDTIEAGSMLSGSLSVVAGLGMDSIVLGAGNDTVSAQTGADNDVFYGGSGVDVLSHAGQTDGLMVSVTGLHVSGGADGVVLNVAGTATDAFFGFESLVGGSGNDTFAVGANVGNVSLDGGAGNDLLSATQSMNGMNWTGGAGSDTLSYTALSEGQSVSISSANANGGMDGVIASGAGTGFFYGFESLVGGSGNDTFAVGANVGNASMDGGAGNDTFRFVAVDPAAEGAGFGGLTVTGFDWSQDALNLQGFWSVGVVTQNNLNEYVQMSGSLLQVDMDGTTGTVYTMSTVADFSGQQHFSSLSAMFATDRLTITSNPEPVIPT